MNVREIQRPHPRLLVYYGLISLLLGPLFPLVFLVRYFRYHTLRYSFGDDGIAMSWGILFRREIHLTYSRIQDIHLRSNVVERWLGLARVLIQTASGSAEAEMVIEGVPEFEALRDFIYRRMRGAEADDEVTLPGRAAASGGSQELTRVLEKVAAELAEIRLLLRRHDGG